MTRTQRWPGRVPAGSWEKRADASHDGQPDASDPGLDQGWCPLRPGPMIAHLSEARHDRDDQGARAAGGAMTAERGPGREVMHGRRAEQVVTRGLLERAQRGIGGVLLVDGEPGIGKSSLLREAAGEAAGRGFFLAAGAAGQLGRTVPFAALCGSRHRPLAADDPGRELPAAAWWITQLRAGLERRAEDAPVLVCLDDLHWVAPARLAMLGALPGELQSSPVAWLLARSTPGPRSCVRAGGCRKRPARPSWSWTGWSPATCGTWR